MKTRILATFAIATLLAVGVSAPAFATEAYTGGVSSNTVAPGGTVQYTSDNTGQPDGTSGTYSLSGASSALGAPTIELASKVSHVITVGSRSQLRFSFKIPETAKVGSSYTLSVKAGKFADTQTIKIAGVAASLAAAGSLAPLWIVLTLAVLIVLALIVVVAARRRNSAKAA